MERLGAVALHPNMMDLRVGGKHHLGHRVGEIGFVLERDEVLDHRDRAAGLRNDQATRVAGRVLARRNEQQMNRCRKRHVARHDDQRPVVQECGIERRERVALESGVAAEVRLHGRAVKVRARGKIFHRKSGMVERMLRRINTVDEYQPGRGFGYGPLFERRGRKLRHALRRLE